MDRIRRLTVLLVMLVVAGLVVLVVAVRPGLRGDEDAVDRSWRPLVAGLSERYDALGAVVTGLRDAGAGDREITKAISAELERWGIAATGTDADDQVQRANRLEALAARARALAATPRLGASEPLQLTFVAFDATGPAADALTRYNDVVERYQRQRDGFWSRIVARLDGYDMRPTLQLGGP
jgi:hypothetical protein